MGKALGKSVRRVAEYLAAGMPAGKPGAYDVDACRNWLTQNIRQAPEPPAAGSLQERLRLAELQIKEQDARARKLKTDRLDGKLYNADDIERGAAELTGRIKLRLEQLPDEVAQCVPAKERTTVRERVTQVVDQLLLEMSTWDPIATATDDVD